MDYMTGFPKSQGYDAILVFVDMKSKDYVAIPCNKEIDSEGQANLFIQHWVQFHGLPERIWSDRGSTFVSSFIQSVYTRMGIKGNPSTAYHPQTDGQTERINQEIQTFLRIFCNHRQDNWVQWLPLASFVYRNRVHSATGMSPFYMTHRHKPYTGVEVSKNTENKSANQWVNRIKCIQKQADQAMIVAKDTMKQHWNKHYQVFWNYQAGDLVYLDFFHISTDRPSKKLENKRYGSFEIAEKIGASAY